LTGLQIFIGLSHHLATTCLVQLIKSAVIALADHGGAAEAAVAHEVHRIGRRLHVTKNNGEVIVATGYEGDNDDAWDQFVTANNAPVEPRLLRLHPFELPRRIAERLETLGADVASLTPISTPGSTPSSSNRSSALTTTGSTPDSNSEMGEIDSEFLLVSAHHLASANGRGEIESAVKIAAERGIEVPTFHSTEVNIEAACFCSWALSRIATVCSSVEWLRKLPVGYEIIGSTRDGHTGEMVTEVACARLDYDVHGRSVSSYMCQFHPELAGIIGDVRADGAEFARANASDDSAEGHKLLLLMLRAEAEQTRCDTLSDVRSRELLQI